MAKRKLAEQSIPKEPDAIRVSVKRETRFGYLITLNNPHRAPDYWLQSSRAKHYVECWYAYGTRAHAERKARRKLRKELRLNGYTRENATIFKEGK